MVRFHLQQSPEYPQRSFVWMNRYLLVIKDSLLFVIRIPSVSQNPDSPILSCHKAASSNRRRFFSIYLNLHFSISRGSNRSIPHKCMKKEKENKQIISTATSRSSWSCWVLEGQRKTRRKGRSNLWHLWWLRSSAHMFAERESICIPLSQVVWLRWTIRYESLTLFCYLQSPFLNGLLSILRKQWGW